MGRLELAELQRGVNIKKLTTAGVMAALIFVFTWVIRIPVPGMTGGYIHIGDSIIYCASFLLGGFYGAVAAGIGSALADLLAGAYNYIFATLVIKAMMGFVCAVIITKPDFKRFVIASITGGAVMVAGYGAYEWLFFGAGSAAASVPYNLIQWAGGVVIALPLYKALKNISTISGIRSDTH
jgi:uncharacterized membrane protein